MKNTYRRTSVLYCIVAAAIVTCCSSSLSYNEALQRNAKNIDDPEKQDDARFLVEAASYNMFATELAKAAINSAYSASIVRLAKENLEEHDTMGKELKKLARKEDVVLPAKMNEEHQRLLAQLTGSDRREFDRTYIRVMREASDDDSSRFSEMATKAESEDVRAFAARKLDLFESQKTQLETADAELLKTY
jgi:putative membrane protein